MQSARACISRSSPAQPKPCAAALCYLAFFSRQLNLIESFAVGSPKVVVGLHAVPMCRVQSAERRVHDWGCFGELSCNPTLGSWNGRIVQVESFARLGAWPVSSRSAGELIAVEGF